jgi:hypothetical protein
MPFKYNPFSGDMDYYRLDFDQIRLIDQATPPETTSDRGQLFTKIADKGLYFLNSAGVETPLGVSVASVFDATVGASGADYTTVGGENGAAAAGKKVLMFVDDVTETTDFDPPAGNFYVFINGYDWDFGASYQVNGSSVTQFEVDGRGGSWKWSRTGSNKPLIAGLAATSYIVVRNITLDTSGGTGSANVGFLPTTGSTGDLDLIQLENVVYNLANAASDGLTINETGVRVQINNLRLNGGGTSCSRGLYVQKGHEIMINDLRYTGTWASSNTGFVSETNASVKIDGIHTAVTNTDVKLEFSVRDQATNFSTTSTAEFDIKSGGGTVLSTGRLGDQGTNSVFTVGSNDATAIGLRWIGSLADSVSYKSNTFIGCEFKSAVTIKGDHGIYIGCMFDAGATVNSGANDNVFIGCRFGPAVGGGASTLSITNGALRTRVSACASDAAIDDNDASSAIDADSCTVY